MKKLLVILLCLLTLCSCGEKDSGTMVIEEGDEPAILAGGWYVNPDLPAINDAYFDAATKDLVGVGYTPLLVLGSQVVAGTNYAYLAYGTVVTPDASASYKIVKVYVNLQNEAEVLSISDLVLENYLSEDAGTTPDGLTGGFTDNSELPNLLDEDLNAVFSLATKDLLGVEYTPICLLASQVVAGTNYAILAKGTIVSDNPTTHLYIFNIYESLDGSASINNISGLDLSSFE